MYRRKFDNLNRKLALKKEKALEAARKSQIDFYIELTKDLYLSYYSDIGRKGFFVPIFYKMIAYVYILLTHKSVEAANFKP